MKLLVAQSAQRTKMCLLDLSRVNTAMELDLALSVSSPRSN